MRWKKAKTGAQRWGEDVNRVKLDPYQKWVSATYHALVRGVVKSNNWGLNIVEITAKLGELLTPEYRQRLEATVLETWMEDAEG